MLGPKNMAHVLQEKGRRHRREDHIKVEVVQTHASTIQVKDIGRQQNREEAGKESPQDPSEGEHLCKHIGFGLLTSRTAGVQISITLRHQVCDNLSQ